MDRAIVKTLVVEDNPGDAERTAIGLEGCEKVAFDVATVGSLAAAEEWLREHPCDLALVDLNLPDSTGVGTVRALKRLDTELPVVVVSGLAGDLLSSGELRDTVEEVIPKDEVTGRLFANSVLYVVERNRARRQHLQLERILAATPDAVVVVDRQGVIKYLNDQALAFFERTREELSSERLLFAAKEGEAAELRVSRPTGEKVGEMRVVEFEWDGQPSFLAAIRDITRQRNLELQLLTSDRLVSLGTLAAGIAHEINNPLAALLANLSVASQQATNAAGSRAELLEVLGDAREAGERIRQIVRDLRTFSRVEDDDRTPINVHRILDSVARMAWTEIRHSATVRKDYGDVPLVNVNEPRLSQVFLNLLVNAGQAIGPGHADHNQIRIVTRVAFDGRVAIDFHDTGPGIPPEVQRRLFTPFFTTKPVGSGTGLGLAICQRIVRGLGGEITFESEVGRGTVFTVLLPPAIGEAPSQPVCPADDLPTEPERRRVLVIDDDLVILRSLNKVLRTEHDVTCFERASRALEVLLRGERFDVILCDLMMPEMTGMEFYARIEQALPAQAPRVVFMTGGAFTLEAREFLEKVPRHRLEKPFDLQGLRALIRSVASTPPTAG